ncbi:hypothetical protein BH24ACT21_BH24ACT21_08320 [soil metagenome]|jgi:hypothetical protein
MISPDYSFSGEPPGYFLLFWPDAIALLLAVFREDTVAITRQRVFS